MSEFSEVVRAGEVAADGHRLVAGGVLGHHLHFASRFPVGLR